MIGAGLGLQDGAGLQAFAGFGFELGRFGRLVIACQGRGRCDQRVEIPGTSRTASWSGSNGEGTSIQAVSGARPSMSRY